VIHYVLKETTPPEPPKKSWRLWIGLGAVVVLGLLAGVGAAAFLLLRSDSSQDPLALAEEAFRNEQWYQAMKHYAGHLQEHPEDLGALSRQAEAVLHMGGNRPVVVHAAAKIYFRMATLAPEDAELRQRLLAFCRVHELWDALALYVDHFLADHPDDTGLRYSRALALARLGRVREAIALCRSLIDSANAPQATYSVLAWSLRQRGLTEQALAVFDDAEKRFPGDPAVWIDRARFLLDAKNPDEAKVALEPALAQQPPHPEALLAAAEVANALGECEAATTWGRQALAALADSPRAYHALAWALERNGETQQALEVVDSAPEAAILDAPELLLLRAEVQIAAARLEDAHETMGLYRQAYPEHFLNFDYLEARQLLATGHAAEAAAKLTTVVESDPDFDRALYWLAIAHDQSGQPDRARRTLDVYRRDHPGETRARLLWEAMFAWPKTPAEAARRARALLDSGECPAQALVLAARALIDSGTSPAPPAAGLVAGLFETAIERDATSTAHEELIEFLALQGDRAGARRALAHAQKVGIRRTRTFRARAAAALAEGDLDAARGCFGEAMGQGARARGHVIAWAQLFASHGYLDQGIRILEEAAATARDDEGVHLLADRAALATRVGHTERALDLIRAMERQPPDAQRPRQAAATAQRLNAEKLAVARRLMAAGPGQDQRQAQVLIDEVARLEPQNPEPEVLQARMLLLEDPPDYARAEAICVDVLEAHPTNANAQTLLADILEDEDRPVPQPKKLSIPAPL